MFCSNCGAEISDKDAYCPYCGVINPGAAEREYMEKLDGIREDTEKLGDESALQTQSGIRRAGMRALRILAVIIVVILVFAGLFRLADRHFNRSTEKNVREEAAFKEQYFDKLDAYYESGNEDATADFLNEIGGRDGSSVLNTWKHYEYMRYYMDYREVCRIPNRELDEDFRQYALPDVLYDGLELIYQTVQYVHYGMNSEEREKVDKYRKEAEEIFAEYLSCDRAVLDEIYENSVDEGGYLYHSKVREWVIENAES